MKRKESKRSTEGIKNKHPKLTGQGFLTGRSHIIYQPNPTTVGKPWGAVGV